MRILIHAHAFAPKIGGAETYVLHLARGLADGLGGMAAEVTLATPTPGDRCDVGSFPFRVVRRPGLRELWRLTGWADVVQLAGPSFVPLAFALTRRKPVVLEHHGYQAVCPNGLLLYEPDKTVCPGHFMDRRYGECLRCNTAVHGRGRSLAMLLLTFPRRWMCRHAAVNVSVTHHVADRLSLPRGRVVYYGIPDAREESFQDPSPTQRPVVFAYVGRFVSEKGLPLLLQAARTLRSEGRRFSVRFIGDGPERPALERLAAELGLRDVVRFTGFLEGEGLRRATDEVTAVVMPSIWEETAGLAAIEQMMRGRLVIASDIGGLGEVVDGAGLTFPPGDAVALADRMRRVLEEPGLVSTIGRRARARALELFDDERMVREHAALYRSLARSRR